MSISLLRLLRISPKERDRLGEIANSAKTITDFVADAAEATKGVDLAKAVSEALPWADIGEAAVESAGVIGELLPPVRFVVKLFEVLTREHDPYVLGYVASTLAYQHAIEQ